MPFEHYDIETELKKSNSKLNALKGLAAFERSTVVHHLQECSDFGLEAPRGPRVSDPPLDMSWR